ncbi:unnamed protein product [Protopolystoma xenopodis]|uniref:Ig-like domain-containing protein n=1 Tax=Protopolystoma xenopodis TaxID=117903 RepID=A0A3S5FCV2_9PLAT|nr:unnamed protein product [Protopolystoma xenopodis]
MILAPPGQPIITSPSRRDVDGVSSIVVEEGDPLSSACTAIPAGQPPGSLTWRLLSPHLATVQSSSGQTNRTERKGNTSVDASMRSRERPLPKQHYQTTLFNATSLDLLTVAASSGGSPPIVEASTSRFRLEEPLLGLKSQLTLSKLSREDHTARIVCSVRHSLGVERTAGLQILVKCNYFMFI